MLRWMIGAKELAPPSWSSFSVTPTELRAMQQHGAGGAGGGSGSGSAYMILFVAGGEVVGAARDPASMIGQRMAIAPALFRVTLPPHEPIGDGE